jgi:hypothetical protein
MPFLRPVSVFNFSILLSVSVVGCNQSESTNSGEVGGPQAVSVSMANEYCPIMGVKVSEEANTVEWDGKIIGFCCDGCDEQFMTLSDKEKAEKLAGAEANRDADHEAHQPSGHDHS